MWWCQPRGEFGVGFVVVSLLVVDLVVWFLGLACVYVRACTCE